MKLNPEILQRLIFVSKHHTLDADVFTMHNALIELGKEEWCKVVMMRPEAGRLASKFSRNLFSSAPPTRAQ